MNKKIYKQKLSFIFVLLVSILGTYTASAQSIEEKRAAITAANDVKKQPVIDNKTVVLEVDQQLAVKLQKQAQFKALCPHYPESKTPGADNESVTAYENWKKSYPEEYAAYLKIFNLKQ